MSFNPLLYTPIGADRNIIFETLKLVLKMNIKKSSVTYIFVFGSIGPDRVQRINISKNNVSICPNWSIQQRVNGRCCNVSKIIFLFTFNWCYHKKIIK